MNYIKAAKVDREDADRQAAILLACIGSDAYEIYTTMEFDADNDREDPTKLLDAFEKYCIGEVNEVYERYVFHRRQQEPGEPFDLFVGDLRRLVKSCGYGTVEDSTVRDRIVLGIRDDATRRKLLQTRGLDLMKAIDICRSSEAASKQLKAMTTPDEVHALQKETVKPRRRSVSRYRRGQNRSPSADRRDSTSRRCKFCDRNHPPSKEECKAFGAVCKICKKKNHFASVCKSKPKDICSTLSESEEDKFEESLLSLRTGMDNRCFVNILLNGHKVEFLADTGSTANVVPVSVMTLIGKHKSDLRPARSVLSMFDRTALRTVGMLSAKLVHPRTKVELDANFYVAEAAPPVLGVEACRRLDIVRIVDDNVCEVREASAASSTSVHPTSPTTTPSPTTDRPVPTPRRRLPTTPTTFTAAQLTEAAVREKYADLFDDHLGLLEGDVHLEVDATVKPVQLPLRRLPVAIRDRVQAELQKMVDNDVIAAVTTPTPWVSALLVVTKQDGSLRICIDPKPLNRALLRSTYYMPTVDDVLPKLSNAKVFSTTDAKNAFWHLKLDEESSYLTTFETPFGRFRFLRCPYGISPAPEIYQARMHAAISGLSGIHCIADDLLITGSGDTLEAAERDHDKNLIALLDRCREKGIKLNPTKLRLRRQSISYLGHVMTSSGMKPDPRKVAAITEMPQPTDKKSLQRVLGMATYLARYCKNFSDVTAPLRELLRFENEFIWSDRHTESFNRLKAILSAEPILAYYAPEKELICQCDSSQSGLGAVLLQEGKVIEYASRALTSTETQYAQIEKELLSIYFGLSRFDTYCYGRRLVVQNDHKPLLAIYKKCLAAAPKRLQRMWLKLQRYDFELVIKTSSQVLLADTLSRAFPPAATETTSFSEELAALSTVDADQMSELKLIASAGTIDAINRAAAEDGEYDGLINQIRQGWPDAAADVPTFLRPFHTFADELSVSGALVYKGHRLVVPRAARAYIIERLHTAHTGVNACQRRARETVFWPGITVDIKRAVESCAVCASHQAAQQKEPLKSYPPPARPWEVLGVDIFTIADMDYLITVDYLTGWFEVDRLPSKATSHIIYCLKQHFARHGLPLQVVSDNSPFASREFRLFAQRYEFEHTTSSPRYSQSNGRVEAAVKTAKRIMIKASETNTDAFLALLEFRNTPSEQLGRSPAQLMFNRRTRTLLPIANQLLNTPSAAAASVALAKAKERQAVYYNRGAKERPPLSVGDTVRVKFDDNSNWKKAEVAEVLPHRSYNVRFEDGTVRRRTSKHVRFSSEPPIVVDLDQPPAKTLPPAGATTAATGYFTSPSTVLAGPLVAQTQAQTITRSGRIVKRPARYCD